MADNSGETRGREQTEQLVDVPTSVSNKHVAKSGRPYPTTWLLLRIWTIIGLQSFGGGASTFLLIQQAFVEKYAWVGKEEFVRFWSLCYFTPGINLLAVTVLIGRKLRGVRGIIASLGGLLLPSAIITCLLTAGFKLVQNLPAVQAMLRGIVPATAGIMLVTALNFAIPLLKQGKQESTLRLSFSLVILFGSALILILLQVTVVLVLLCAALAGTVLFTFFRPRAQLAGGDIPLEEE